MEIIVDAIFDQVPRSALNPVALKHVDVDSICVRGMLHQVCEQSSADFDTWMKHLVSQELRLPLEESVYDQVKEITMMVDEPLKDTYELAVLEVLNTDDLYKQQFAAARTETDEVTPETVAVSYVGPHPEKWRNVWDHIQPYVHARCVLQDEHASAVPGDYLTESPNMSYPDWCRQLYPYGFQLIWLEAGPLPDDAVIQHLHCLAQGGTLVLRLYTNHVLPQLQQVSRFTANFQSFTLVSPHHSGYPVLQAYILLTDFKGGTLEYQQRVDLLDVVRDKFFLFYRKLRRKMHRTAEREAWVTSYVDPQKPKSMEQVKFPPLFLQRSENKEVKKHRESTWGQWTDVISDFHNGDIVWLGQKSKVKVPIRPMGIPRKVEPMNFDAFYEPTYTPTSPQWHPTSPPCAPVTPEYAPVTPPYAEPGLQTATPADEPWILGPSSMDDYQAAEAVMED